ncbi:MAG: hypothetical protein ACOC00_00140 [Halothiobacillaceae bacterium]
MAFTNVKVANLALLRLKQDTIQNWDEDTTQGALAATAWELARLPALELGNWTFATKYVSLSYNTGAEPPDFAYEFDLPADFVRVAEVMPSQRHQPIEFKRRGQKLYSDTTPLPLFYIYDHDNPGEWSPLFCSVMAWRLAGEMATSLQDAAQDRDQCMRYAFAESQAARAADAANTYTDLPDGNHWNDAR